MPELESPAEYQQNRIETIMDSDLAEIDRYCESLEKILRQHGWSEDEASGMEQGVREALQNAIIHGNLGLERTENFEEKITAAQNTGEARRKKVHINVEISPTNVQIVIQDEGGKRAEIAEEKFLAKDPTAAENLLAANGRGGFLMQAYFDKVEREANEQGTKITLTKNKEARS